MRYFTSPFFLVLCSKSSVYFTLRAHPSCPATFQVLRGHMYLEGTALHNMALEHKPETRVFAILLPSVYRTAG